MDASGCVFAPVAAPTGPSRLNLSSLICNRVMGGGIRVSSYLSMIFDAPVTDCLSCCSKVALLPVQILAFLTEMCLGVHLSRFVYLSRRRGTVRQDLSSRYTHFRWLHIKIIFLFAQSVHLRVCCLSHICAPTSPVSSYPSPA